MTAMNPPPAFIRPARFSAAEWDARVAHTAANVSPSIRLRAERIGYHSPTLIDGWPESGPASVTPMSFG